MIGMLFTTLNDGLIDLSPRPTNRSTDRVKGTCAWPTEPCAHPRETNVSMCATDPARWTQPPAHVPMLTQSSRDRGSHMLSHFVTVLSYFASELRHFMIFVDHFVILLSYFTTLLSYFVIFVSYFAIMFNHFLWFCEPFMISSVIYDFAWSFVILLNCFVILLSYFVILLRHFVI
jgi:hypothetical protein